MSDYVQAVFCYLGFGIIAVLVGGVAGGLTTKTGGSLDFSMIVAAIVAVIAFLALRDVYRATAPSSR